jgi:hypothetical protein
MENIYKIWWITLSVGLSASSLLAFQFTIEPKTIQPGERATLTIRLSEDEIQWNGFSEKEVFPSAEDDVYLSKSKLLLLERQYRKIGKEFIWNYAFTSYKLGEWTLAPIQIHYGPYHFSTEAVALKVQTSRLPDDGEARPNPEPLSVSHTLWIYLLLILGAFAGVVWVLWRYKERISSYLSRKAVHSKPAPHESPEDWARRRFQQLRFRLQENNEPGKSIDELTDIIKRYFYLKMALPATSWTSVEWQIKLSNEQASQFNSVWKDLDVLKFSGDNQEDLKGRALGTLEFSENILCGT